MKRRKYIQNRLIVQYCSVHDVETFFLSCSPNCAVEVEAGCLGRHMMSHHTSLLPKPWWDRFLPSVPDSDSEEELDVLEVSEKHSVLESSGERSVLECSREEDEDYPISQDENVKQVWLQFRQYMMDRGEPDPGPRTKEWLSGPKSQKRKKSCPVSISEPTRRSNRLQGQSKFYRLVEEKSANAENTRDALSGYSLMLTLNLEPVVDCEDEVQVTPEPNPDRPVEHMGAICSICSKRFRDNTDLRRHNTSLHTARPPPPEGQGKFVCKRYWCEKALETQYEYMLHMESCKKDCPEPGCPKKGMVWRRAVEEHARSHTRAKKARLAATQEE